MTAAITAAVIGGGAMIYAANKSANAADAAYDSADQAARLQYDISEQQLDLAKRQWYTYSTKIMPLEMEAQRLGIDAQELAKQRGEADWQAYQDFYLPMQEQMAGQAMEGIKPDPERAAREARMDIDQAFDVAEGTTQRNLERRGVMPGSGSYGAGDVSLAKAAAQAQSVNRAVEGERDRAEDVNFNRLAVALGRQPLAANPTQSPGAPGVDARTSAALMGAAGQTAYGAGSQYAGLGNTYGNSAGNIISGGVQLGMQAYDLYNKYAQPAAPTFYGGGGAGYAPLNAPVSQWGGTGSMTTAGGNGSAAMFPGTAYAEGGPVQSPPMLMRNNGALPAPSQMAPNPGGAVNGPPGRDQVPAYIEGRDGQRYPARLQDEEYVIPADVVRQVGTDPLDEIVEKARERRMKGQNQHQLVRRGGN